MTKGTERHLLLALVFSVACLLPATTWAQAAAGAARVRAARPRPPAMVVLVRHAEKATAPADDPPLTAEGRERAKALAAALQDARLGAIITTQWTRTRETAAPAADAAHLVPRVVTAGGPVEQHAAAVAAAIRHEAGKAVLVVGHSNTVPAIITALTGLHVTPICDAAFDDFFVLVPAGNAWRLVLSRYGAASPRASCR
jgi:phosphohistidine phosphatase SixA